MASIPEIDDDAQEIAALTAAVTEARNTDLGVPHEEVREWLLEIADGNFRALAPKPRRL
jgi:hypothetical protein